jgi:hypothetical protein
MQAKIHMRISSFPFFIKVSPLHSVHHLSFSLSLSLSYSRRRRRRRRTILYTSCPPLHQKGGTEGLARHRKHGTLHFVDFLFLERNGQAGKGGGVAKRGWCNYAPFDAWYHV